MTKVKASLDISVWVDCPECGFSMNLMDRDEMGVDLNDDERIIRQVCPTDGSYWSDSHERFKLDDVQCPNCPAVFDVETVEW